MATKESERFKEESGISLDQSGNAANLGGNLGITRGSDGSVSVGGENGIQVAAPVAPANRVLPPQEQ